jgi:hypothetical protein
MNNSFITGLWGVHASKDKSHFWQRLSKCENDIKLFMLNPYAPKVKVYIFGEENFKRMVDLGFECCLIDKKPYVWDMELHQYRHKIEIWKYGCQDFDSIVFMDWDTIPIKPIPENFWSVMHQGEPIKATILQYKLKRVNRKGHERKVSSASMVYIRGIEHVEEIIKTWEEMEKPCKEEYPLSKYIDSRSGGWKGVEDYAKNDIIYYELTPLQGLPKSQIVFKHFNHNGISALLGDGYGVKERIDKLEKNK